MRIGIAAHPHKPLALALARRAVERLAGQAEVLVDAETQEALGRGTGGVPLEGQSADVVLSIGGDGTFLWTLQRVEAPLLPVNAGTVGFLAEVDGARTEAFDRALERLLRGEYVVEAQMKLGSSINGVSLPDATNEVVIHTAKVGRMRLFEVAIDGRSVGRIRSDGVILATPTGSTSYALSALGPIVDPGVEGIVVAALAPFQATHRAVVVDPLRTVSVRLVDADKDGIVVVDGQSEVPIHGGASVLAYRSPRPARFIRFGGSFFQRLVRRASARGGEQRCRSSARNVVGPPASPGPGWGSRRPRSRAGASTRRWPAPARRTRTSSGGSCGPTRRG
jgi:NAD+ kinase